MKLLEKILVPIDTEINSEKQINLAIKLAQKYNSKLIIVRVLPEDAKLKSVNRMILEQVNGKLEKIAKIIEENNIKPEIQILYGNSFDQTISLAEQEDVNLILVNSEDSDLSESGSAIDVVTEKLIRKSEKPVWVIKNDSNEIPKQILCPVDFSDPSKRALTNAIKIARIFQAKLHIINVFTPLQESFAVRLNIDYVSENQALKKENDAKFDEFINQFNLIELDYKKVMLTGKPHQKIIEYAKSENIDLLFMGTTGKSLLQRVFIGSVTEMVLRALPCSIVTTKSEDLLNLKIDSDISNLEKHFKQAKQLQESGYYNEAINQLKICLKINDLHIPAISALIKLYKKLDKQDEAELYSDKLNEILRRLWDKKIELEIRRNLKL
jgi:universal stress protein E